MNTSSTEQKNTYTIIDSMGRKTGIYLIASNINDACAIAKTKAIENKLGSYYKVKRCYSGGVRGSQL